MDPNEEFRVYLKALSQGLADDTSLHISEDDLIAYQKDRLRGPERGRIQHHFMQCSSCLDRFKDISDFFEPPRRDEESLSEAAIGREWESFSRRNLPRDRPTTVDGQRGLRRFFFAPRTLALAAMLIIILTAGWGFWLLNTRARLARQFASEQSALAEREAELDRQNRRLQELEAERDENEARVKQLEKEKQELERKSSIYNSQIAQLKQPELNAPIYDIYSQGSAQRSTSGNAANSVVVARKAKTVTLILNGADQPEHRDYAIEMVDQKGRLSWRREGLKRDSLGNFVVTLNRASLGEGEVLLKVYGRSDKGSELIGQYRVSVRTQD